MSWTLDHPLQRDVHRPVGPIFLGILWFKLHKTQLVMRETFVVTLGDRTRHLLPLRRIWWATRTSLLSPFYGQNGRLFPYPDLAYTRRRGGAHVYGLPLYPQRIVSSRRLELLLQHMSTPTLPLAHDVLCPPAFAQPCPSILRSRGLHTLSAGKTLPQSRFFRFQHKHIIVQKIDLCQWTGGVKVFHRLYKYHINILWLV